MENLTAQAKPAIENLLQSDEDQLYEELGIRAKALSQDAAVAGSFEPDVAHDAVEMSVLEDMRRFGKRLFRRWNKEAHNLICGTGEEEVKDRETLLDALKIGGGAGAAAVASLLVAHFTLAPAIAAVIAALIIKRFWRPTADELCKAWGESLAGE